jgi:hypothetical protein
VLFWSCQVAIPDKKTKGTNEMKLTEYETEKLISALIYQTQKIWEILDAQQKAGNANSSDKSAMIQSIELNKKLVKKLRKSISNK